MNSDRSTRARSPLRTEPDLQGCREIGITRVATANLSGNCVCILQMHELGQLLKQRSLHGHNFGYMSRLQPYQSTRDLNFKHKHDWHKKLDVNRKLSRTLHGPITSGKASSASNHNSPPPRFSDSRSLQAICIQELLLSSCKGPKGPDYDR